MKSEARIAVKIVGTILALFILFFSLLTYISITRAQRLFEELELNKAVSLVQTLDANISGVSDLVDIRTLQTHINKLMWVNPDLVSVSINLPQTTGLRTVASNNDQQIGKLSSENNQKAILTDEIISGYTQAENARALQVIAPLHIAGQAMGTYELVISLSRVDEMIQEWQRYLGVTNIISLLVLLVCTYALFKIVVFKPLTELSKGIKRVSEGDLEHTVAIKSHDEIGQLGIMFNTMTQKLKDYKLQLESYSRNLEKQVEDQTVQLQEKSQELNKRKQEMDELNKLLKNRGVKMAELVQKTQQELTEKWSSTKTDEDTDENKKD